MPPSLPQITLGFQDKANFPEGQASILQLVSSISPGGSLAKSLVEGWAGLWQCQGPSRQPGRRGSNGLIQGGHPALATITGATSGHPHSVCPLWDQWQELTRWVGSVWFRVCLLGTGVGFCAVGDFMEQSFQSFDLENLTSFTYNH